MLFASTELATRIERADCDLARDIALASRRRRGVELYLTEFVRIRSH